MFCDLVGSTALTERLDAEDFRELIDTYQQACSREVRRLDGYVAQLLGDGVLAYFGFPRAHEDDAQRAIRAGLAVQAALAAINQERGGSRPELRARIGIHSGPVIVSQLGSEERHETLALGETVNIAARLDALAPSGGVVVSDATLRLAPGAFFTRDLGEQQLKGVSLPLRVHAVERALGGAARRLARPLTPLRGREEEVDLLLARWELSRDGRGQVVVISGEPGIGKSRLLSEFRERLGSTPHSAVDLQCSPFATGSAFQPSVEAFETGLEFGAADGPEVRLEKLEAGMAQLPGVDLAELIPYLGALLGLPPSPRFPLEHTSAEVQRLRTLRALLAPLLAMERLQPVVISFEDLHWADQSSVELIGHLIDQTPTMRLLLMLTLRPTFEPPWPLARSFVTSITLGRLRAAPIRQLIETRAGLQLPERVVDDITARADGVPLYAEEITRAVIDSGVVAERAGRYELIGRIADVSIPTTLQGSLMARLDRLSDARPVAQIGATLGREFSLAFIETVSDLPPATLRRGLAQLVDAEILYVRGEPPDATYSFKHVLLQDTAYESQLRPRRRELHGRAAGALEQHFPSRVAAEPQLVARHCAEAGQTSRAVDYFARAGQQAVTRLANAEAVDYFERALRSLATLPADASRDRRELALRLALAGPLSAQGTEHPATVENLSRAEALCEAVREERERVPALFSLAVLHQARGDLARTGRWARELLAVAEQLEIAPLRLAAHAMLGAVTAYFSSFTESCEHFAQVNAIAEKHPLPLPSAAFDVDLSAGLSGGYAMSLVLAGHPDQALAELDRGLARARAVGHAYTLALALSTGVLALHFRQDHERLIELAEECLRVTKDRGFIQNDAIAVAFGGWARVMLGDEAGAPQFERGLQMLHNSGALGGVSQFYVAGAEIALRLGRLDQARAHVDRIAYWANRLDARTAAANVPLLRAEILLAAKGDPAEIERLLLESIDGSEGSFRSIRSPWMELRSALRLAELALLTGKREPARARLAELESRFSEGFATLRLREAKRMRALLGD